jgi:hypothetical protein
MPQLSQASTSQMGGNHITEHLHTLFPERQVQNRSMYIEENVKLKKQGLQSVVVVIRMSIDIPLTLRVRGYWLINLSHLGQSNLRNTI